ncbi:MAG: calcium/proton exchanger [Planctomycetota bacterium]|nr:calcium/proton exchanger [Planctomycetota bacterium]
MNVKEFFAPRNFLNWFLFAIPAAVIMNFTVGPGVPLFIVSAIAVVPLAGQMGHATEALAARTSAAMGGFLNASLGNLAELLIAAVALLKGPEHVAIVKASITGSIIGNLLLIMGAAIFAGCLKREHMRFNRTMASTGSSLLFLSVIGLLVPSMFAATHQDAAGRVDLHTLSLWVSGILLFVYACSLWFSLKTHKAVLAIEGGKDWERPGEPAPDLNPMDDEGHGPHMSSKAAITVLCIATLGVVFMAEMLIASVEIASHAWGMSQIFVGVVIVAVVGNAAEHSSAIMCAMRGNMDLGVNIPIESSKQIALFAAPFLVFFAAAIGVPLDLDFSTFEILAVALSVLIVHMITSDGETHWLEGVQLLAVYLIFAVVFFFLTDADAASKLSGG